MFSMGSKLQHENRMLHVKIIWNILYTLYEKFYVQILRFAVCEQTLIDIWNVHVLFFTGNVQTVWLQTEMAHKVWSACPLSDSKNKLLVSLVPRVIGPLTTQIIGI